MQVQKKRGLIKLKPEDLLIVEGRSRFGEKYIVAEIHKNKRFDRHFIHKLRIKGVSKINRPSKFGDFWK